MEITGGAAGTAHSQHSEALAMAEHVSAYQGGPGEDTHGACQSGAALGCTGLGFTRVLPESLAPGLEAEHLIQCDSCYAYSAGRLARTTARLIELGHRHG